LQLRRLIAVNGLLAEDIFNTDEKGFLMGRSSRVKVICKRSRKNTRKTQDGNREIITVIETVCAAGGVLPPMIIYKGRAHYKGWTALVAAGDKAFFAISEKGWTSRSIGVDFLVQNFEPHSRTKK